jgi:hypothetical protein
MLKQLDWSMLKQLNCNEEVDPAPFTDSDLDLEDASEREHYEDQTCMFCRRNYKQVPVMVFQCDADSGYESAICSWCVEMCNQLLRGPDAYRAWANARTQDNELKEGLQLIKDTAKRRMQSGIDELEQVLIENPGIGMQEAQKIARERGQKKLGQLEQ